MFVAKTFFGMKTFCFSISLGGHWYLAVAKLGWAVGWVGFLSTRATKKRKKLS